MRKIYSLLLMATMLLLGGNAWATEPTPDLTISTKAELIAFEQAVNTGNTYAGKLVVLAEDIDLAGVAWKPIGNVAAYPGITFAGTFDGQNHTISNLTTSDNLKDYATAGLFGSAKGTIKNLKLTNIKVNSTHYAGAICGYNSDGNLVIDNCHVIGGTITSTAELIDGSYDNGDKAGGIAGYIVGGTISNCSVEDVAITAYRHIGGLLGYANGSSTIEENSVVDVTITCDKSHNYKNYTEDSQFGVNEVVGVASSSSTTSNNVSNSISIEYVEKFGVAKIGSTEYETLTEAIAAATSGQTITLLADLENIGEVNLPAGVTLDGDNHKISGASGIHINAAGGAITKVNFENIHNTTAWSAADIAKYGVAEGTVGTQTAVEASALTGAATITYCTFDNVDWDAIRVVPSKDAGEDLAITITDNIFKHTNAAAHQLRYIHLEYVQGTSSVGRVTGHVVITDNQFLDQNQTPVITAILVAKMDADEESNLTGNYYSNREKGIETSMSYNITIEDFYPMRSQADVDVDDLQIETAQIGTTKYATLAAAFEAANASSATSTIKLLRDVDVNTTYTVNNTSGKWIALDLNGHNLTATVPVVNAYTQFNYQNTGKDALTTVPEDGNLFTIQEGVKLMLASGIFSSNSVEKYLDKAAYFLKDLGNGTYQIKAWTDAEALAAGYLMTTTISNKACYFKTLTDAVDYAKANAKTSVSPKLLADVTTEDASEIDINVTINPNGFTFTGAVNSTKQVGLSAKSTGTVNFTELNAATLANGTSTAAITIEDGNVGALTAGTGVTPKLTIKGGTYGFDPTAYVAEGYEAVDNHDNTWTVSAIAYTNVRENLTIGSYGTICLEQEVVAFKGATFYAVSYIEGSEVELVEVSKLVAGYPYVFIADEATIGVIYGTETATEAKSHNGLIGSFTREQLSEGLYIIYNDMLYMTGANNYVGAHKAYFDLSAISTTPVAAPGQATAPQRRRISTGTNTTTGVENIVLSEDMQKLMINGQLYIVRGGKMFNVAGQLVK